MGFKRLLGAIGVGGPSVDTVLDPGAVVPGGALSGRVHLRGGSSAVGIEQITLELVARVEAEHEGGESEGFLCFERFVVGGGFRLAEGEERAVPFQIALPWETPVTELYGQPLGIVLGVRTELAVSGGRDRGDLDPLSVRPLPVQEAVLEAFGQAGFGFRTADLEMGHIGGTGQRLPFYQEIEMLPPPRFAHAVNEVELTFLASPNGAEVVLEADKRGGLLSAGHDAVSRVMVSHDSVASRDWNAEVEDWMTQLIEHRASFSSHASFGSPGSYGSQEMHGAGGAPTPQWGHAPAQGYGAEGTFHDVRAHDHGHRSGPGVGTAVAAGAAGLAVGVVGGLVAAEAIDEIGDFFEGDEESED